MVSQQFIKPAAAVRLSPYLVLSAAFVRGKALCIVTCNGIVFHSNQMFKRVFVVITISFQESGVNVSVTIVVKDNIQYTLK